MRGLKIVLFASLAVNVLVIGAGGAFWVKHKDSVARENASLSKPGAPNRLEHRGPYAKPGERRGPAARQAPPVLLWPLMSQLSREERRALAQSVRDAHRKAGLKRSDLRESTLALADAVETEPFDAALVQKSLTGLRGILERRATVVEQKMLTTIQAMPLAKRKALAEALRKDRRPKRK